MDAKTRHELKQNELAEALAKLRNWDNPATRYTILGIAVLVLVFAAWKVWNYSRAQAQAASWVRLMELNTAIASDDPERLEAAQGDLRAFVDESRGEFVGGLAAVRLARVKLMQAQEKPDLRATLVQESIDLLTPFASAGQPPRVEAPARFALASAHEFAGDYGAAREHYEVLRDGAARFAGSPFVKLAAGRLENLDEVAADVAMLPGSPPAPPPVVNGPPQPDRFAPPTSTAGATGEPPAGEPRFLQELRRSIPVDEVRNPPPVEERLTQEDALQRAEGQPPPEEGTGPAPSEPPAEEPEGAGEPGPAEEPPPATQPSAP